MSEHIGKIRFVREPFGRIGIGQQWNPHLLDQFERTTLAETLREIAAAIDRDEFEVGGEYVRFPIAASAAKEE